VKTPVTKKSIDDLALGELFDLGGEMNRPKFADGRQRIAPDFPSLAGFAQPR
jgi:hypothetical protein